MRATKIGFYSWTLHVTNVLYGVSQNLELLSLKNYEIEDAVL